MVHIALLIHPIEIIQFLGFFGGTKSHCCQHLGFTAGKQTRGMRAGGNINFGVNFANFVNLAVVRAFAFVQNAARG